MDKQNKLLDYISVKGSGEIKDFYRACQNLEIEPPWLTLENLCILGHMDVEKIENGWWSCSYPSLALLPNREEGVLCGARSPVLLEKLKKEDIEIEILRNSHSPEVWKLSSIDNENIHDFAKKMNLYCNKEPATYELAKILPPLPKYIEENREKRLRFPNFSGRPQRWNPEKRDWKNEEKIKKQGLWMIYEEYSNRPIFILKENGSKFEIGDINAAKFYVDNNRNDLVSYNFEKNTFTVKKGLRLPRLYGRVLCLCSGELPKNADDNKRIYENVPRDIARTVAVRIGCSSTGEKA